MSLTSDFLKTQLTYYPLTGNFYKENKLVGSKPTKNRGYVTIWVKLPNGSKKRFDAHRLAYLYVYGFIPPQIDHIDGDKSNNCISNLRPCADSENRRNSKKRKDNTSGYKGVSYFKSRNMWNAKIGILREDGSKCYKNLGYFDTKESAYKAYCSAAQIYHKEFKRLE